VESISLTLSDLRGINVIARPFFMKGLSEMDDYASGARAGTSGFDPPPVFIAGDSQEALDRAARTIESSGLRIADRVLIDAAPERLERQIAASALWIELDLDCGAPMDRLLDQVNRDAGDGRYPAVVAAPSAMLDAIDARLTNSAVAVVVDGDEAERTAALAVALSGTHRPTMLSDVAADRSAARLRQLSDEVSRIASTLARLSTGPAEPPRPTEQPPGAGDVPDVTADTVRTVIRARRLRSRYFEEGMFADPAWDMLLDLLQAEIAQLRVPVSSLCIAASVPATTALRWLKMMTQQGLFLRRPDPHDGRRVFVELAPAASLALRRYFAEAGRPMVV
jgi:DNA-binding MarR family transcriptional regulator